MNEEVNEEEIRQTLKQVEDPVLEEDIVSLGLVTEIKVKDRDVLVKLAFNAPYSPAETMMAEQVGRILSNEGLEPQLTTDVPRIPSKLGEVKNIIAVTSGKGGVGKTTVAANIAAGLDEMGAEVGILDGDVHGPDVPHKMALDEEITAGSDADSLTPADSGGVSVMSLQTILPDDKSATFRGPIMEKILDQFVEDVEWGSLDYLVIDMPPGTGDVPVWLVKTLSVTGAVVVTTPQPVAVDDSRRGVRMFKEHGIPVLGVVENMNSFRCSCGSEYELFGSGGGDELSEEYDIPMLDSLPLAQEVREADDPIAREYDSEMGEKFRLLAATVADHVGGVNREYISKGKRRSPLRASE